MTRAHVELARRAGCRLLRAVRLPDGQMAYELDCKTHERKTSLLLALAEHDSRDPRVRRIAELASAGARGDPHATIVALHRWVMDRVRFAGEPVETFSDTLRTLEHRIGDCDDSARALCALLLSIGFRARMATLGDPPTHVACIVRYGGRWRWLETTIPGARAGEHPLDAAARLGVSGRADLR